jgi:hypothetical protein
MRTCSSRRHAAPRPARAECDERCSSSWAPHAASRSRRSSRRWSPRTPRHRMHRPRTRLTTTTTPERHARQSAEPERQTRACSSPRAVIAASSSIAPRVSLVCAPSPTSTADRRRRSPRSRRSARARRPISVRRSQPRDAPAVGDRHRRRPRPPLADDGGDTSSKFGLVNVPLERGARGR